MTIKASLLMKISYRRYFVEKFVPFLVKFSPFWDFLGIKYWFWISWPPKGTSLSETASFELLHVKIHQAVWPVGDRVSEKRYKAEKFWLYFTYLPKHSPWEDLHQIWHSGSSPGRNQLRQIFWQSVQWSWFCELPRVCDLKMCLVLLSFANSVHLSWLLTPT